MILRRRGVRPGTYALEFAIVAPVFLMLLFAHILGGLAVFQYQQMAALAREGARWAAAHGYDYRKEKDEAAGSAFNTTAIITNTDVFNNAIAPKAVGVDLTASNVSLSWQSTQAAANKDQVKYYDSTNPAGFKQNYVTVQVTFTWVPIINVWGVTSKTMTASSTVAVTY